MLLQIQSAESSASSLNEDTSFAMRNKNEGGNSHSVKPKKIKKNSSDDLLSQAAKVLNEPTNDLSVFSQYVATELRSITSDILRRKTKAGCPLRNDTITTGQSPRSARCAKNALIRLRSANDQ